MTLFFFFLFFNVLLSRGGGGGEGRATFEKRLREVFVNPSLIISTELENKSPVNEAEPEIMPGF